jgi:pancreatic triacylglycerol lipase
MSCGKLFIDLFASHTCRVYVEIMHTAGGSLGFGLPLGQADFYPNFGRSQPGCGLDLTGSCAHGRAPIYFAESINSSGFKAQRCASPEEIKKNKCTTEDPDERIVMTPEPAHIGLSGFFYVTTNSDSPFAKD